MNEDWGWTIDGYGNPMPNELQSTRDAALTELLRSLPSDDWPDSVEAIAYAPVTVQIKDTGLDALPLRMVLETLDNQYADPEAFGSTRPTPAMKQAEREFLEAVTAEYTPWALRQVHVETLSVEPWISDHPEVRPAPSDRSIDNSLLLTAPPTTMNELRERLLSALPATIEHLPAFSALSGEQQAECVRQVTNGFAERFEVVLEEQGGPDARLPEDLAPFSELLVHLGAQAIRECRSEAAGG